MSRLESTFSHLRSINRSAFIPFFTAGDPAMNVTVQMLNAFAKANADIIEIGIPFSDPIADGPVIQQANERALNNGSTLRQIISSVAEFRITNQHTPIILMGYLNPIETIGYKEFSKLVSDAGVDGVIIVDLTTEEADDLMIQFKTTQVDIIFLLSPTSSNKRINLVSSKAGGFLYYVSMLGTTGSKLDPLTIVEKIENIKKHTSLPIAVGFGIQDVVTAASVAKIADAVVVGSPIVKEISCSTSNQDAVARAEQMVRNLANAVHNARL